MNNLDQLDDLFKSAEEPEKKEFEPLPEGIYHAVIKEAVFDQSTNPMVVKWTFSITDDDYKNRRVWMNHRLNEQGMPYFKADLNKLHMSIKSLRDLPEALEYVLGMRVELYCKNREYNGKIYTNAFINNVIETETHVDDDIPL